MIRIIQGLLVIATLSACAATPATDTTGASLPPDVSAFMDTRNACDHFRGESDGDDPARALELQAKMAESCTGTDAVLAQLRRKYARNDMVISRLNIYETGIE